MYKDTLPEWVLSVLVRVPCALFTQRALAHVGHDVGLHLVDALLDVGLLGRKEPLASLVPPDEECD